MTKTILLADDSMTIQKVVELTFMDQDYQVVAVSDGSSAIAKLTELNPDLVIADVHMPGADGYEVCRQTKATRPGTPVLLLVGTFEQFDQQAAAAAGADGDLKKPFDSQELLGQVERLVSQAAAAADAHSVPEPAPAPAPQFFTPEPSAPVDFASPAPADFASPAPEPLAAAPEPLPATEPLPAAEPLPAPEPLTSFAAPEPLSSEPLTSFPSAEPEVATPQPSEVAAPQPSEVAIPQPSFVTEETAPVLSAALPVVESHEAVMAEPASSEPNFESGVDFEEPTAAELEEPAVEELEAEPVVAAPVEEFEAEPVVAAPVEDVAREVASVSPAIDGTAETRPMPSRQPSEAGALSDEDVERIARRVAELISKQAIDEVVWEVVPDLAEVVIKDRIRELETQVESA